MTAFSNRLKQILLLLTALYWGKSGTQDATLAPYRAFLPREACVGLLSVFWPSLHCSSIVLFSFFAKRVVRHTAQRH